MCGIVARYRYSCNIVNDNFMVKALESMKHRGPDGFGSLDISPELEFGHHRLAIIGPDNGEQPMVDNETGVVLTFNGEIYNYIELRKTLISKGYVFLTNCDTEVLLKSYIEYGIDCIQKFNGMFSFVLWDPRSKDLYAVRDRLGIKPLYYYHKSGKLIVASELKTILVDNDVDHGIGSDLLYEYLVFGFTAGKNHLISSVKQLRPGEYMHINAKKQFLIKSYWALENQIELIHNENDVLEELDAKLKESVKYRLRADVPLAIVLSGGVDSSLISHYAEEMVSGLTAYSLRVLEENYDETKYAKMVCANRDINFCVVDIDGKNFADLLDEVIWYYDDPVLQTNTIGLYKLCQKISSDGIKVLIGGEGADELFGGYGRHLETLRLVDAGQKEKILYGRNEVSFDRISKFWSYKNNAFTERNDIKNRYAHLSHGQQILRNDQMLYLTHLLQRPDRMGMACGIEMRVPFLDHNLVELANSIDSSLRFNLNESKYLLKKLTARYLPHDLIYRDKLAFDTPIAESLARGSMNEYFQDHINKNSAICELFDLSQINAMMSDFKNGKKELWRMLWQLLSLERFMKLFKCSFS
jgi:asparagine synthase (glutamine-hydrolysing)